MIDRGRFNLIFWYFILINNINGNVIFNSTDVECFIYFKFDFGWFFIPDTRRQQGIIMEILRCPLIQYNVATISNIYVGKKKITDVSDHWIYFIYGLTYETGPHKRLAGRHSPPSTSGAQNQKPNCCSTLHFTFPLIQYSKLPMTE